MQAFVTEAFFQPSGSGTRFYLLHRPAGSCPIKGSLLHVPAFAEEMNKSRHAISATARSLACNGWWVLQHDLLGCGDSSGDFADATWTAWLEDTVAAFRWLAERSGITPQLWGLRLGCLLATDVIEFLAVRPRLLLWQPVLSGSVYLNQFLRLKVASNALASAGKLVSTKELLQSLRDGASLSVAGYRLSPMLAQEMARAELHVRANHPSAILLCEIGTTPGNESLSPGLLRKAVEWQETGCTVTRAAIDDLPFWQTQEIADGSAFRAATLQHLQVSRS